MGKPDLTSCAKIELVSLMHEKGEHSERCVIDTDAVKKINLN